ncbi:MAG TPA: molybdopterin dinucleotide binding domain-containing protein [Aggregatilineaceae bacterium]|nr:molybdopterin dinucleotide binding domain-containing protein [Aggregatilineaceae bacterium]
MLGGSVGIWTGSSTSHHLTDLFTRFAALLDAPAPIRHDLYATVSGYHALEQAHQGLFGRAALPAYNLANVDVIFSFGAEFLGSWLSPTGFQYDYSLFRDQTLGKRGYFVQFEPRMSNTGAVADRWVPVRPGAYALVAQAIARIIADESLGGEERASRATSLAGDVNLEEAAAAAYMSPEELVKLARAFATAERPVALPGGYVGGVEAMTAVQALNLIAGAGGLSLPVMPPAEGFSVPGTTSFADVQSFISAMNAGDVQVLLIHGANPAYDLPASAGFVEALKNVETVISFSPLIDETAVYADYVLPDRVYLEGWGYQVVNPTFGGRPAVSSQQPVVAPLYDIRSTGDVLLTIAKAFSGASDSMPWTDEVAFIQAQVAALPAGATGGEDEAVRWARFQQHGGWWSTEIPDQPALEAAASTPVTVPETSFPDEKEYPYFLNLYLSPLLLDGTGASIPWLQGTPDPMTTISWQTWIEINPETADDLDVKNGDVVRVRSPYGEIEALVYIYPAIRPDTVAIPFGQGHRDSGRYAKDRGSNPVDLLGVSDDGTLAWSTLRVKVESKGENKHLAVFESTVDHGEHPHYPLGIERAADPESAGE